MGMRTAIVVMAISCCGVVQYSLATSPTPPTLPAPVKILFDTDMQTDCDDAAALAVLHALADNVEAEILATVVSVKTPTAVACVDAINTYYGRPDLPLGVVKGDGVENPSKYIRGVAAACPHDTNVNAELPDAVDAYRRVLEAQPDQSVVVLTVGYVTNLRKLLEVKAERDRLSGRDLAAKKVKLWVCMGGNFIGTPAKDDLKLGNVNFQRDAKSALAAINGWPTPIVFVGREVASVPSGVEIGRCLKDAPTDHPARIAYELYFGGVAKDRHVADVASVLYAVRGQTDCWDISPPGRMELQPDMKFEWKDDAKGPQRYLLKKRDASGKPNDEHVEKTLETLLMQPARGKK